MNADGKVLLVEDEVLVAALAVDALEELGYQTLEVDDRQGRAGDRLGRGAACCSRSWTSDCPMGAAMRWRWSCAMRARTADHHRDRL